MSNILEIVGYILSFVIGFTLGILGGGGSILTVPVLVYLLYINPATATAYSLFIVGTTSSFGVISKLKAKLVNFKIGFYFGIPSIISVFITRLWFVPSLPETIVQTNSFTISKGMFIMLVFAILMIIASYSMIKGRKVQLKDKKTNPVVLMVAGLIVGTLAGFVGAGGGFLIIPTLILFTNVKMKEAVGTSLFIMSIQSLIGFSGDVVKQDIDWSFLLFFTCFSILGVFVGNYASKSVKNTQLKKYFGWFVLIMGVFIIIKEVIL